MKLRIISLLVLPVIFCAPVLAEKASSLDKAFDLIDRIVKNDIAFGLPSAQIAVMKDGEFLFEKAWGKGVSKDTLFDLASNTKPYSVVYMTQYLVSRGLLDIDTPIVELAGDAFSDEVLDISYTDKEAERVDLETQKRWKREITVRDVLCHRAGIPETPAFLFRKDYKFAGADENPLYVGYDASAEARSKVFDALCRMPLYYEPGTKVMYSDTGYILLSLLIEKITGEGMQELLSRYFWKPLGLKHITYNPLNNGFRKEDCAPTELHGNTRDGSVFFDGIRTELIRGQVHDEAAYHVMAGVSGHAGIFANAHDLAILANVMIDNAGYFSDDTIRLFTGPASEEHDEWGLGWYRQGNHKRDKYFSGLAGEDTIGHQGWTGTLTVIDPREKLVIVILTNKRNTSVTDPHTDKNEFDGNKYTTAKLGFAAKIIYQALHGLPLEDALQSLVEEMEEQHRSNPCAAAERALASIRKTQQEWKQEK